MVKNSEEKRIGEECGICGSSENKEDIIETPDGYYHRTCLDDSVDNTDRNDYEEQERESHLHNI